MFARDEFYMNIHVKIILIFKLQYLLLKSIFHGPADLAVN